MYMYTYVIFLLFIYCIKNTKILITCLLEVVGCALMIIVLLIVLGGGMVMWWLRYSCNKYTCSKNS